MYDLVAVVVGEGEEPVSIVRAKVNAFPSLPADSCSNCKSPHFDVAR
jgi:hypothetical protein